MLEEIKKIELEKLDKYLELQRQVTQIEEEIEALKPAAIHKPNFLQRLFNKSAVEEHVQAEKKWAELVDKAKEIYDQINKYPGQYNVESVSERKKQVEEAKTLKDIGYSLDKTIAELKKAGIKPVFDQEDVFSTSVNHNYLLVHLTDYMPHNDRIVSKNDSNEKVTAKVGNLTISYQNKRATTHFEVNAAVASHAEGDWTKKKYVILIPMSELPDETKISGARLEDFQVKGSVELTENCIILCPDGEEEQIRKENSKVQIMPYKSVDPDTFDMKKLADSFIVASNYELMSLNEEGYGMDHDERDWIRYFDAYIQKRFGINYGAIHADSLEKREENLGNLVSVIKEVEQAILAGKLDYNLNTSDINDLLSSLFKNVFNNKKLEDIFMNPETNVIKTYADELKEIIDIEDMHSIRGIKRKIDHSGQTLPEYLTTREMNKLEKLSTMSKQATNQQDAINKEAEMEAMLTDNNQEMQLSDSKAK